MLAILCWLFIPDLNLSNNSEHAYRFFILISEMKRPQDAMKVSTYPTSESRRLNPVIGSLGASRLCHNILYSLCYSNVSCITLFQEWMRKVCQVCVHWKLCRISGASVFTSEMG